jgi:hypothetical protein
MSIATGAVFKSIFTKRASHSSGKDGMVLYRNILRPFQKGSLQRQIVIGENVRQFGCFYLGSLVGGTKAA